MIKKHKIWLIITAAIVCLAVTGFVLFQIFIHTYYFEIMPVASCGEYSNDEEYEEWERLVSNGYAISYPTFNNKTGFNAENDRPVYNAINKYMYDFAMDVAKKYKNYAKLDYTVDVKTNDTLTVAFAGTGYFYHDSEPEPISKTFVFDIKNVSPEHLPTLLAE